MANKRIIFHIDVNSAFLSWESVYRLTELNEKEDLREIAAAIGGDIEKRKGVILAKSIPAQKYKISTGEPIVSALKKCPTLKIVKPNFKVYVGYSKAFIKILQEYTPLVEQYSIDEAFMDMTGTEGLYGDLIEFAYKLKDRIYNELGFTVNIGISSNKLLAKMASDFEKPNKVHTLFENEIQAKMWPLSVGNLLFVGHASVKKLNLLGIKTIGDLAKADINLVRRYLGKQGEMIHRYANGISKSEVNCEKAENKGYWNSTTLPYDINTKDEAYLVILSLCETVCTRLRRDKKETSCISVSMVDSFFEKSGHQIALKTATHSTEEIYKVACKLFDELWDGKKFIRQLGVATSKLTNEEIHQINLFETKRDEKKEKLDKLIDKIRTKYGEESVKRASFISGKLNPLLRDISKQKD